jgi:hypothetical protein
MPKKNPRVIELSDTNYDARIVGEDEVDENARAEIELKADPSAIPDLSKMLEKIYDLLKEADTLLVPGLSEEKRKKTETRLSQKYNNDISSAKIISLMLADDRYENLDRLLDMFDRLEEVKKGRVEINDAQRNFGEKLNEKYVYPKFGGKEEFEKKMAEEAVKK